MKSKVAFLLVNYLPAIDSRYLYNLILTRSWVELENVLKKENCERLGFDRLVTIIRDMEYRYGSSKGFDILDVGCNNGFFSVGLSALENIVCGVDSYIINSQNKYENLDFYKKFANIPNLKIINQDILDFLNNNDEKRWDFVLLLSVAHQWEFGYAHSGESKFSNEEIKNIINTLFLNTNFAVYYECPFSEPGFEMGYGYNFLERFLENVERYRIELIEETVGSNGYPRHLYRVERRN